MGVSACGCVCLCMCKHPTDENGHYSLWLLKYALVVLFKRRKTETESATTILTLKNNKAEKRTPANKKKTKKTRTK